MREPEETLRAWRNMRGLTLEQVGNILGVGPQAVHKWETGKTPVDLKRLRQLAEIYGTTADAILFAPTEGELVERMRQAHHILTNLPPDKAADWLSVGQAMAPEKRK